MKNVGAVGQTAPLSPLVLDWWLCHTARGHTRVGSFGVSAGLIESTAAGCPGLHVSLAHGEFSGVAP